MPDAGYFGLTYELLFEGDSAWTDITSLVDSRTTKVDIAGCSEDLKSVISKCTFEMRYNSTPSKTVHSELVGKILSAKQAGQTVQFRMGGIATFVGKVDLGSFSQKNGRIPGFVTVTVEDNSYLLDEKMDTSFEYPANDDLDDEGWAVFDKTNLAQSIVMLRFLDAGYTIDQIDLTASDSITEKVRRVVYDADDERTYREMLDTLLFEHCAVIYTTPEGKLSVRRLYRETPVSERSVEDFLVGDGIQTGGGDYAYDGVKVVWSNLSRLDGAVVYNANITMKLDDEGNREGEEIQPQHYWPEDGDIEETWQEFNATFLDRAYQTKVSRLKNKDLSLISVKNAYYEVDKDAEILLANNPPEIEPTKARVLWWNSHSTDVKKLYGFTIVGDALFRSKLNETTYPVDAKRLDEPYETEFVYTSEAAAKLANHLHRFRKYGDLQHKWTEIGVATPMFQVVTVSAPDTLISSLGMVISQSITFPAPNKVKRANSAIGITAFNSEPVKTRSIQLGGAPVNTGPAGENGMRFMVQYALGTIDAPYTDGSTKVGTDLALVGTSIALLGTDNSGVWTNSVPSPALGEYVWRREGYYIAPATFPTTWEVIRMTGNKGDASVHGELSNDSHTVPTDVNGDNGNFTGCETSLHMYVGGSDDSDNWIYTASISAGITASLVGNTLTVTAMTADTGYVDITASKSGYNDVTRRFSVSKSKQGAVGEDATSYWLVSSVAAVKKTQASAYVPATLTFSSKSQTGESSPAYYDGRFVISESTDGLAWTMKYTSASDEHTKEYTPSAGIVAIKCELYQAGGTVLLLDEETVPFVLDGTDGAVAQGVYLTASRGAINVTSRGTVYGTDILISAVLQNITGTVTWSVDVGTGTLLGSDNLFRTLDISTVTTDEIVIKATVAGFSATCGFAKVYDGLPAPMNFGGVTSVPKITPDNEPLVTGDYFLWAAANASAGSTTDPVIAYPALTKGEIYEYNGTEWVQSTNGNLVMTMFDDFAELANDVDETVIGNAVIKKLVAIRAFIEELSVLELILKRISGKVGSVHSEMYNADGSRNLASTATRGVYLNADGIFKAVNAELIGSMRTGEDAPIARLGVRDQVGVMEAPVFTGTGLNDFSIVSDGKVAGLFEIKITGINDFTDLSPSWWQPVVSMSDTYWQNAKTNSSGLTVVVGNKGKIMYSTGLESWTVLQVGYPYQHIYGIAVNASGRFVINGYVTFSKYSDDGVNWLNANMSVDHGDYAGVAVNSAGLFVAMTRNGYVTRSSSGDSWSTPASIGASSFSDVYCDRHDRFFAVGSAGIWYSDDGVNWYKASETSGNSWLGIAENGSVYVVVGTAGLVAYSTDGLSWSAAFAPTGNTNSFTKVALGNDGMLVALHNYEYCYTYNGSTWYTVATNRINAFIGCNRIGRFFNAGQTTRQTLNGADRESHRIQTGGVWGAWSTEARIPLNKVISFPTHDVVAQFANRVGHTINDIWTFEQKETRGLVIEDSDGIEFFSASDGQIICPVLPTSASGLPSGTLWNDSGTLKVAP